MKEITLELINKCYNRCLHCSSESDCNKNDKLTLEQIKEIIGKYNPQWVNLSGGEPLLYDNLTSTLKYLKSKDIKVKLYTTGNVCSFKDIVNDIKEYIDIIVFSYHSNNANIFNLITDTYLSHKHTQEALKYCLSINMDIEAHIVPMTVNLYTIDGTIQELLNMGVKKINLLKLVNQGRCKNNQYLIPNNKILQEEMTKLHNKYKNKIKLGLPLSCGECVAGKEKLVMLPNGEIIPCESYKDGVCKCERVIK